MSELIGIEAGSKAVEQIFLRPETKKLILPAGSVLFDTDSVNDDVYFVRSGEIRFFQVRPDGGSRLVGLFGPGQWVGTTALAGVRDFPCRCVVSSASEVLVLKKSQLISHLLNSPEAAVQMFQDAVARLMNSYDAASGLVFDDCNERLIKALVNLSYSPAATRTGETVTVRITHQQLAQAVGAARETISLALTELRHQNLLQTGRNRLTFNPEVLKTARPTRKPRKRTESQIAGSETVAA
jgi:CRP/FNR family cyclic AMP-dependent transcriptional regulator